ncbi:MAG: M23 family metallopeptidase [Kiritimatiellae bacterium]|nr:M23 family metallopeptidase [Kiritimatiellia bacterium]
MYELPQHSEPGFWLQLLRKHGWWLGLVLVLDLILVGCWLTQSEPAPDPATSIQPAPTVVEQEPEPEPEPGFRIGFPTPQTRLVETNSLEVYMATGSGRVESAWYGSVRTRKYRSSYLPSFHEGVDIAPTARDARGRALDDVFAVADGTVGYINRVAGNSSYGIYVVLLHESRLGEVFTLYAHLASASDSLRVGHPVTRGDIIGRMGHTSTLGIPVQRSHLHFEFGTVLNRRFETWFRGKKLKPNHGMLHGYNLTGLNPMGLFDYMAEEKRFDPLNYIKAAPVAFRMVVPTDTLPDYYQRYPALWVGEPATGGAMVMEVSEGGVPLFARAATDEEKARISNRKPVVLEVFPDILGRNGERLVVKRNGEWQPGRKSEQWLDILLYR